MTTLQPKNEEGEKVAMRGCDIQASKLSQVTQCAPSGTHLKVPAAVCMHVPLQDGPLAPTSKSLPLCACMYHSRTAPSKYACKQQHCMILVHLWVPLAYTVCHENGMALTGTVRCSGVQVFEGIRTIGNDAEQTTQANLD